MDDDNEVLISEITQMLMGDELTGRAMSDSCTDGFETHYVLLAQRIVNTVLGAKKIVVKK